MHGDNLCAGFIDIHEERLLNAIHTWSARGWNYREIIEKVIQEYEAMPKPGQPKA
jgi:hypothetical protein